MNRSFSYMSHCVLIAATLCFEALAQPCTADTVISIIGGRTPVVPDKPSGTTAGEPPLSSVKGNRSIRIIGDKQSSVPKPADRQAVGPEPNRSPSAIKETCFIGDNVESSKNMAPDQMTEPQLTQRLDTLKAEVARKDAEKAELTRIAPGEDERGNTAALQAAIEREQEQLAAGSRSKKPTKGE